MMPFASKGLLGAFSAGIRGPLLTRKGLTDYPATTVPGEGDGGAGHGDSRGGAPGSRLLGLHRATTSRESKRSRRTRGRRTAPGCAADRAPGRSTIDTPRYRAVSRDYQRRRAGGSAGESDQRIVYPSARPAAPFRRGHCAAPVPGLCPFPGRLPGGGHGSPAPGPGPSGADAGASGPRSGVEVDLRQRGRRRTVSDPPPDDSAPDERQQLLPGLSAGGPVNRPASTASLAPNVLLTAIAGSL